MPGESPSAEPPRWMTFARNSRRPSARFDGFVAKPAAEAPSPCPRSPWHAAQWVK